MDQSLTYSGASKLCRNHGAHLATPRTAEENQCVTDAVVASHVVWLGYRGGETEESFAREDGCGALSYTNWYAGQPDLEDEKNCVDVSGGTGVWFDASCATSRHVVCQLQNCYRPQC